MLIRDCYIIKRLFISLIGTVWTVCINAMTRTLRIFINCLRISFIVFKRVLTKGEQCIEKQGLLEMAYQRHLSEAVDRYELAREKL